MSSGLYSRETFGPPACFVRYLPASRHAHRTLHASLRVSPDQAACEDVPLALFETRVGNQPKVGLMFLTSCCATAWAEAQRHVFRRPANHEACELLAAADAGSTAAILHVTC